MTEFTIVSPKGEWLGSTTKEWLAHAIAGALGGRVVIEATSHEEAQAA